MRLHLPPSSTRSPDARMSVITPTALNRTIEQNRHLANCKRSPTPQYAVGQKVWLSTKDIHLKSSLKVHSVFHVSIVKPVLSSPSHDPGSLCVNVSASGIST
ncbi:hypothetical protein CHARACLAT_030878 [Characodon lateralis]|uniref:Uncharacterized protein n=1 Tax=Characodon lateralis TaxID=208331 RepID=A0ABU7CWP6_9TELE|nr:hypothetical protein [Characodon lateralis]